jgi:GxxExxY protein
MAELAVDATGNDLTYRIIGAAMAVHNAIGPGYPEHVYERALAAELDQRGIAYQRQYPFDVYHNDVRVGLFILDLFVEQTVVVELKALRHLTTDDEVAQVLTYLKGTGVQVGLLLNFARRRLEYRRIFPSRRDGPERTGRYDRRPPDRR